MSTMVPPGLSANSYEAASPAQALTAPTAHATSDACRQLRATASAQATGTVIIELTINEPTVRDAMETVSAHTSTNAAFTAPTRTPARRAARSSSETQNSSFENARQKSATAAPIPSTRQSSVSSTVTMLPKRKLENVDELGTKPESTPASPIPAAMMTATARSARLSRC